MAVESVMRATTAASHDNWVADNTSVPVMIVPLLYDAEEAARMLFSIDAPVRQFVFVWNSDNPEVGALLSNLSLISRGVTIFHDPTNSGFSGAVNAGIRGGIAALGANATWFFVMNADALFPEGSLARIAQVCNSRWKSLGLIYGPVLDHYAFAITRTAFESVGYFDEVFWPAYMEDVDYHWRVRLAGLKVLVTNISVIHTGHGSTNLHRRAVYRQMVRRVDGGFPYGRIKWGYYYNLQVWNDLPPSGYRTPFNISGAPLSLWKVDPIHRECARCGTGPYADTPDLGTKVTCWYNATVLYQHQQMPVNASISPQLLNWQPPTGSIDLSFACGSPPSR